MTVVKYLQRTNGEWQVREMHETYGRDEAVRAFVLSLIPPSDMCWDGRGWDDDSVNFWLMGDDAMIPEIGIAYTFAPGELENLSPLVVAKIQNYVRMQMFTYSLRYLNGYY